MKSKAGNVLLQIANQWAGLDPQFSVQTMKVFIIIAENEGCSLRDIMKITGFASSTTTRNVRALDDERVGGGNGYHLIQKRPHPMDTRAFALHLTPKGKAFYSNLKQIVEV